MLAYLSPAWVEALDRAARADERLAEATRGVALVLAQRITGGPDGDVAYHVRFDHGSVSVAMGPGPEAGTAAADVPVVRFVLDHATALDIARGIGSAQRAFMAGTLQVGGDLRVLLEQPEVFSALHDVFGAVRADTELDTVPAGEVG
ncbi:MAG: SCP2 sterol-binding domain-containing protein [Acidimicrobiales bacterium]